MKAKNKKLKICKCCGKSYPPARPLQKACGLACALILGSEKAEADKKKADAKALKLGREALKTKSNHVKDAQTAVNAYVRERDAGKECISCDRHLIKRGRPGGDYDAGHYRSRGSAPHLRFDENNIHGQCKHCNLWASGNAANYRIKLIQRIGLEAVEALEADQTERKYTVADLKAIRAVYVGKLKELRNGR